MYFSIKMEFRNSELSREMRKSIYYLQGTDAEIKSEGGAYLFENPNILLPLRILRLKQPIYFLKRLGFK